PIYAAPIVVDVDAEDDEPAMEYPRWWTTKHAAQVYDREAKLLEDVEAGDFVYAIYEKAVDWPSSSDDKWERATHLVMTHRLRPGTDNPFCLNLPQSRLTKAGSEHLLLQFMRKPCLKSPALGVVQRSMRPGRLDCQDAGSAEESGHGRIFRKQNRVMLRGVY
ncbi:birA, partial [Symbiodinium necroappetens]